MALVLTLPAVMLAASEQPGAPESAAHCQAIVQSESARVSSEGESLFSALAQARIANICASSGALVVESLRFRSGTGEDMTLAVAPRDLHSPETWSN